MSQKQLFRMNARVPVWPVAAFLGMRGSPGLCTDGWKPIHTPVCEVHASVALPTRRNLELPILRVIHDAGGGLSPPQVYPLLQSLYPGLTDVDRRLRTGKRGVLKWPNEIQFARQKLVEMGELAPTTGIWRITPQGEQRLARDWPNWRPDYRERPGRPVNTPQSGANASVQPVESRRPPISARTGEDSAPESGEVFPRTSTEDLGPREHERLKQLLVEIGRLLQIHPKTEVTEGPFRYDVVWTDDPLAQVAPLHAFEVQDKGNLEGALSHLQHAWHVWRCGLSLVVVDERDGQRARQLVQEQYTSGAFHSLRRHLLVVGRDEVEGLHASLKTYEGILKHWLTD